MDKTGDVVKGATDCHVEVVVRRMEQVQRRDQREHLVQKGDDLGVLQQIDVEKWKGSLMEEDFDFSVL